MPNPVAYMMLMLWPLICVALFVRLPVRTAVIWGILGGYLIMPPVAELNLSLVPSLNKDSIASVATFLACIAVARRPVPLVPLAWPVRALVAAFILCAVPTVLTNREPLVFEVLAGSEPMRFITNYVPGLGLRDILSVMIGQVIVLLPFFLGRAQLADDAGLRAIIVALAVAGLAYSLPSLLEINFAPVINIFVYGFFQHDFNQMIREGGFRPIVFLPHGLWLAFFMATATISAAALTRASQDKERLKWGMATLYLALVLDACKSLASLAYGLVLVPVVLFLRRKTVIRIALAIAVLAIVYPALRNLELVPLDSILEKAGAISPERAQSLEFRFMNEQQLLARAHDKPWFGWGGWGRNLVLDPETGMILTIPDGAWIIVFGTFGWLGYIAQMGLLSAPIAMAYIHARKTSPESLSDALAPIALIIAVTLTDMLLNATLTPFTWLCAGAVVGYIERQWYPDWTRTRRRLFGSGPALGGEKPLGGKRTIL